VTGPARRASVAGLGANAQQLSHKVASYVRERIMSGELTTGQYLRTETLADELGVSATPVREALMSLQSEGSVHWEPRRGYRVASIRDQDLRDLFWVQATIAGELAARAATILNTEAVDQLRQLKGQLDTAAESGDVDGAEEFNHEIHRRINKASDSPRLASLLSQTVQYVRLKYFAAVTGWDYASANDHSAVLDALSARDAEAARTAMTRHVHRIGELLIAHRRSGRVDPVT